MELNLSKLKGPMALTLLRTFTARGIAAGGSFALVVVLGRLYGTVGVGVFALAQSLLMGIAIFSRYGMDNALMRFIGRDVQGPQVFAYLQFSCVKALILSTIGGVALFYSRDLWAKLFNAPQLAPVLVGIAIASPAFTLTFIFSGFMKAVRKPGISLLLQNGAIAMVAACLILFLQLEALPNGNLVNIGIAYAVGAWVLAAAAISLSWHWFRVSYQGSSQRITPSHAKKFNRSSTAFFANSLATFMIAVVGFWIAGYFLTAPDIGLLKAAQQISTLIGVIILIINAIYPPSFATSFYEKNWQKLSALARQSTLLGGALSIVPIAVCFFAPRWVLGLVGNDFTRTIIPLYILVFAQLVNVGCGPVGYLLNMTGYEPLVRNIAWIACVVGLLFISVFTPIWGITAVALGIALGIVIRKFAGVYFVWRKLGLWILPFPNILKFLGIPCGILV